MNSKLIPQEVLEEVSKIPMLDYFNYLAQKGVVTFDKKSGRDWYFTTENNKYTVNDKGFYDWKTGESGKIIKAVMNIENKTWRDSVLFLKDFANINIDKNVAIKPTNQEKESTNNASFKVVKEVEPNNQNLLNFFKDRGISIDTLKEHTKQVHFELGDKKYFGIGLQNESQGYDIRNPFMKTKIGTTDITILNNKDEKNSIVVTEGLFDALSFIEIVKANNKEKDFAVVSLNSVTNANKFIDKFRNYQGKINLILDGDQAGTQATNLIKQNIPTAKDQRNRYRISENNIVDLNDYLQKVFNKKQEQNIEIQNKNSTLEGEKPKQEISLQIGMIAVDGAGVKWEITGNSIKQNGGGELTLKSVPKNELDLYVGKGKFVNYSDEKQLFSRFQFFTKEGQELAFEDNKITIKEDNDEKQTQSTRIPTSESVGGTTSRPNIGEPSKTSQSEQKGDNRAGQELGSNYAGDGLGSSEQLGLGGGGRTSQSVGGTQQTLFREFGQTSTTGGVRDRRGGDSQSREGEKTRQKSEKTLRPHSTEQNRDDREILSTRARDYSQGTLFAEFDKAQREGVQMDENDNVSRASGRDYTADTRNPSGRQSNADDQLSIGFVSSDRSRTEGDRGILRGSETIGTRVQSTSEETISVNSYNSRGGRPTTLDIVKNNQPTNALIKEVVDAITYLDENKAVHLKQNLDFEISDDIKTFISQYKSGGVEKKGRGVLDEYYTSQDITLAVRNLIKDFVPQKDEINVLEPSVGTGNFLNALKDLDVKTNITAFEINDTTAKISKILYPEATIYNRAFETEFVDENGHKKFPEVKYDLVVGNPPYGRHRGEYIGLGEEKNISRYEDYFVKRSFDLMKDGGTLAMVLPSSWLDRQKKK